MPRAALVHRLRCIIAPFHRHAKTECKGRKLPSQHFQVSVISRGRGRSAVATAAYDTGTKLAKKPTSAVAAAAYRSGETLHDETAHRTFDYTRKENIVHTEILAPDGVPEWAYNRERLWNEVEAGEKRKDAQLARSIIAGLPRELDEKQQIALVRAFAQDQFVAHGMIADIAIHDKDASDGGRNPHVHIMLTLRDVGQNGFGGKNREWNKTERLQGWRDAWEQATNDALEAAESSERVSLKSYAAQGVDKIPTQHLGYKAWGREWRWGKETDKGNLNRAVHQTNAVWGAVKNTAPDDTLPRAAGSGAVADYIQRITRRFHRQNEPEVTTEAGIARHANRMPESISPEERVHQQRLRDWLRNSGWQGDERDEAQFIAKTTRYLMERDAQIRRDSYDRNMVRGESRYRAIWQDRPLGENHRER